MRWKFTEYCTCLTIYIISEGPDSKFEVDLQRIRDAGCLMQFNPDIQNIQVQILIIYFCFSTTTTIGSRKKAAKREPKQDHAGRPSKKKKTDTVTEDPPLLGLPRPRLRPRTKMVSKLSGIATENTILPEDIISTTQGLLGLSSGKQQ
jgi:hypothetical protein